MTILHTHESTHARLVARIRIATMLVTGLQLAIPAAAQFGCPTTTNGPITQTASITVKTDDGTCTLDNGGYAKDSVIYRLHINAAVTGSCATQAWTYPPGMCMPQNTYIRTISTSGLYMDSVYEGAVTVSPSNTATIQNYDTTIPTNTLSTGVPWLPLTLGAHYYSSSTAAVSTLCQITPNTFPQDQLFRVNVVRCLPRFNVPKEHPELIGHLVLGDITIVVPDSITGANAAFSGAAADWNDALGSYGPHLTVSNVDCGTGSNCVHVDTASLTNRCAESGGTYNASTGYWISPEVTLNADSWSAGSDSRRRRTAAHELGHLLGLDDNDCSGPDSVMRAALYACTDQSTNIPNQPTTTDAVPAQNTAYGSGPRTGCGF